MIRLNPLFDYISNEKNQHFVLQLLREFRRWVTDHREQRIISDAMKKNESSALVQCYVECRDREKDELSLEPTERPTREVGSRSRA